MRQLYAALLRLYPSEQRTIFAAEMLKTFEQAAVNQRARGFAAFLNFGARELSSLLRGLAVEWTAKWASKGSYMTVCAIPPCGPDPCSEVARAENRLQLILRRMEFAISHHDFPKARLYSDEERVARKQLEDFLYGAG